MEKIEENKLLIVTDDQFRDIRKSYNVTKESIDRDVTTLIEWVKLQPHLPEIVLERDWVERIFITNKCYMEKSKRCLDMNLSSRILYQEFYLDRNPGKILELTKSCVSILPLPKLSKDLTRVFIITCLKNGAATFDAMQYFRMTFMILDYIQHNDYCAGYRLIFNLKYIQLEHYLKLYPTTLKMSSNCNRDVIGARTAGYHFLYPSTIVDSIIALAKTFLPEKQVKRIHVHHSFEELYEHIPKEILPVEYDGKERSMDLLLDDWNSVLRSKEFSAWNDQLNNLKSDESKRQNKVEFDEILGTQGSFRELTLD